MVTNCETEAPIANIGDLVMQCYRNRDEHAGQKRNMQASTPYVICAVKKKNKKENMNKKKETIGTKEGNRTTARQKMKNKAQQTTSQQQSSR